MKITFTIMQEEGKENFIVAGDIEFFKFENEIRDEIKTSFEEIFQNIFEIEYLQSGRMEDMGNRVTLKVRTNDSKKIDRLQELLSRMSSHEKNEMLEKMKADSVKRKIDTAKMMESILPGLAKINWN